MSPPLPGGVAVDVGGGVISGVGGGVISGVGAGVISGVGAGVISGAGVGVIAGAGGGNSGPPGDVGMASGSPIESGVSGGCAEAVPGQASASMSVNMQSNSM